ncbi:MAG: hypothetical protein RLY61_897 [Candidatus Parcubacteria bacterium]|jgi:hypothetical protein
MAQLTMTHTRDDTTKPWVVVTQESTHSDLYTAEELNMLIATKQAVLDIPGYISATHTFPNDNTYVITIEFDTLQHAQDAINAISNPTPNSLLELRKLLLTQKRNTLGVTYDINMLATE